MASGFGLGGQQGRCYPFWKAYQECLRTHEPQDALDTCPRVREDYYECLHHRKEVRNQHEKTNQTNATSTMRTNRKRETRVERMRRTKHANTCRANVELTPRRRSTPGTTPYEEKC